MYITCKNCHATFLINTQVIAPNGRKVKCSKCQHIWFEEYKAIYGEIDNQPEPKESSLDGHFLPVIVNSASKSLLKALYLMLIFVIFIVAFAAHVNSLAAQNQYINSHLKISIISCQKQQDQVTLRYKVFNHSAEKITIPQIEVKLLANNNKKLEKQQVQLKVALEPHSYIYVTTKFEKVSPQAEIFAITMNKDI